MLRLFIKLIVLSALFLTVLVNLTGCGEGGGSAVSSSPTGNGYKVILSATPREITSGGSVTLVATVFDPQGNPIGNEDAALMFSSDNGDSVFNPVVPINIKAGTAQTSMQWTDSSTDNNPKESRLCTITASYRGAITSVQIMLISKSF